MIQTPSHFRNDMKNISGPTVFSHTVMFLERKFAKVLIGVFLTGLQFFLKF